jgi:hypothetical protein
MDEEDIKKAFIQNLGHTLIKGVELKVGEPGEECVSEDDDKVEKFKGFHLKFDGDGTVQEKFVTATQCPKHKDVKADCECEECGKKYCKDCVRLRGLEKHDEGMTFCLKCTKKYL